MSRHKKRIGTSPNSEDASPLPIRGQGRRVGMICLALAGLVWLVFGQTVRHDYINYDDNEYVSENLETLRGLTPKNVARAFTATELGLWNPMVVLSHALDCQLFGLKPEGHHLTNVLLHLATVLLLFRFLHQLTGSIWPSAFVAALFAIHPLRVESVAWISERKDVLSGLFFMLTLLAYLHYLKRPALARYALLVFCFSLGLMTKPMLVTIPFVLLLIDYWPLQRLFKTSERTIPLISARVLLEKIPLALLSLALSVSILLTAQEPGPTIPKIPFFTRMAEAPIAFVTYLWQIPWPVGLSIVYPHQEDKIFWWPSALLLILALTLAFFFLRKKYPFLLMGWLWNLGMMVPVCGIVQISRHWQADHYTYLPQIGIYILLTWGILALTASWKYRPFLLASAATLVLGTLTFVSRQECTYWKNSEAVWNRALAVNSENSVAHTNLGTYLISEGREEEARGHFIEALRIDPRDTTSLGNLGVIFLREGHFDLALQNFQQVFSINRFDVKTFNNFAWILATNPNPSGRNGKKALEIALLACSHPKGNNPWFLDTLGAAYAESGDFPMAIKKVREAMELNVENPTLAKELQTHLESYQQGKAWREYPKNQTASGGSNRP